MEEQENIAKDRKKRKKTLGYIFSALALVLVIGVSYAFLSSNRSERHNFEASLTTGTMILTFEDNNASMSGALGFDDSITKKFKIINEGTLASSLSIDWLNLKNTYTNGSLVYKLNRTDSSGTLKETILDETNVPTSSVPITQSLIGEVSIPAHETYYYDLVITLKDLPDVLQDADLNAMFSTGFNAGEESSYRYYTLTVDPNGGTWNTFIAPQEYQLKHNETKTGISDPTREGYTFSGWEVKGTSSKIESGTFTMGISDTYLIAKWNAGKVTVNINIDGTITTQEAEYGETITLEAPTKDGYEFVGWEATGAEVNGNTITITDPNNVTVKPIWRPKKYQYIVYHNKMTTTGEYLPVGVDTDKDTGEKNFGTTFQPPVRTNFGEGFIIPNLQSLTITSNVENNKRTYEYERNMFQLTVDANGGTGGTNSKDMYYEASLTLEAPTRTGYNFTNWTKTAGEGTLADGVVTMGLNGMSVQAGWALKTVSVVLNANGGIFDNDTSITTKTTNVTYTGTYGAGTLGSLPKPTREGYEFVGWFTENSATDGTKIEDTTKVSTETDQTLYARWEQVNQAEAAIKHLNLTANTGTPNFSYVARTDEGIYAMEDDYGTSYYYRGAVTNNYVKFGGFYWRIIRINGDGSLRMIYDGTSYHANGENNDDRYIKMGQPFNAKYNDAKYVGYMFGGSSKDAASTSASDAQTNTYDSDIKTVVDSWYENNILINAANGNINLTKYLADSIFCNGRTMPTSGQTWWKYQSATANLGFGTNPTPYEAHKKYKNKDETFISRPTPILKCPDNSITGSVNNDRFTVDDIILGNGDLKYPIGLITADEIHLAGGKDNSTNTSYYLFKSNSALWSFSPFYMSKDGKANVCTVQAAYISNVLYSGIFGFTNVDWTNAGVAPVINLKPEYVQQLVGTGVKDDEYQIPGVN